VLDRVSPGRALPDPPNVRIAAPAFQTLCSRRNPLKTQVFILRKYAGKAEYSQICIFKTNRMSVYTHSIPAGEAVTIGVSYLVILRGLRLRNRVFVGNQVVLGPCHRIFMHSGINDLKKPRTRLEGLCARV
jgi:hypothetical protein